MLSKKWGKMASYRYIWNKFKTETSIFGSLREFKELFGQSLGGGVENTHFEKTLSQGEPVIRVKLAIT